MMLGAMAAAGALASEGGEQLGMFAVAAVLFIVGVGYWKTLEVTYHLEIQTRAGTARVHSDTSEESVDQMIAAIQAARAGQDPRTARVASAEELTNTSTASSRIPYGVRIAIVVALLAALIWLSIAT
jgi:hypothetical protein